MNFEHMKKLSDVLRLAPRVEEHIACHPGAERILRNAFGIPELPYTGAGIAGIPIYIDPTLPADTFEIRPGRYPKRKPEGIL